MWFREIFWNNNLLRKFKIFVFYNFFYFLNYELNHNLWKSRKSIYFEVLKSNFLCFTIRNQKLHSNKEIQFFVRVSEIIIQFVKLKFFVFTFFFVFYKLRTESQFVKNKKVHIPWSFKVSFFFFYDLQSKNA